MKRLLTITALAISFILSASAFNTTSAQPRVGVNISYQDFYDDLSPYGEWVDYPDYGYVWVPSAGPDFQPYQTNGHWVWSDEYEWMWVSDYDWGWAPFHYGRWFNDPGYGWMWMPGYEWAPAWVAWRDGGDYYGWAPLRPGFNISINFGSYNPPSDYWCFAPRRYISSPRIYDYCMPRRQNITIINNTTIINNYGRRGNNTFVNGPRRGDAERYAGRINPVRFRESNSPGRSRLRGNEVSVYRPTINRDNNRNATPKQIQRYNGNNNGGRRDGNAISRNDNNGANRNADNRAFDRRNSDVGGNDNRVTDRRRNIFDRNADNSPATRPNNNAGDRRVDARPDANGNNNNDRMQRRIDQNNNRNIDRTPDRNDRRATDVFNRPQSPSNDQRTRGFERPDNNPRPQITTQDRPERRNVFERRNDNQQQRQSAPQTQPQRQFNQQPDRPQRQFNQPQDRQPRQQVESRSREMPRGNGGGNRGGGRRDR